MSRGEVLAEVLSTPVLAGLNGQQRLESLEWEVDRDVEGLSSGEWAFLDVCQALHDIERLAPQFDAHLRAELVNAIVTVAHRVAAVPS